MKRRELFKSAALMPAAVYLPKASANSRHDYWPILNIAEKSKFRDVWYDRTALNKAVLEYQIEYVNQGRAVGTLGNTTWNGTVQLDETSHIINDIVIEGDMLLAKISILNTPMGNILAGLINSGEQMRFALASSAMITPTPEGKRIAYVRNIFQLYAAGSDLDWPYVSELISTVGEPPKAGDFSIWQNGKRLT